MPDIPPHHPTGLLTLVNTFTLKDLKDTAEFERCYFAHAEWVREQGGFDSHYATRSCERPGVYINVARWTSPEIYQEVRAHDAFTTHVRELQLLADVEVSPHTNVLRAGASVGDFGAPLTVVERLTAPAGEAEKFEESFRSHLATLVGREGFLHADLSRSLTVPGAYSFVSWWTDEVAWRVARADAPATGPCERATHFTARSDLPRGYESEGTHSLSLEGRIALVTGGARGIGLAVARKLAGAGAQVVINYVNSQSEAENAVLELAGLKGGAVALRADVTRPEELDALLTQVRKRFGRLDILVHNAAVWHPMPAVGARPDEMRADLAVAVDPLLYGAPALRELMSGGSGRIVVVSSMGAQRAVPGYVGLGMAKAAVESLVRYLAVELAEADIAVNVVSTAKVDHGPDTPDPKSSAMLAARTPGGRLTVPEDVADAVALLCMPEAGWIQGQVIRADGGLGLR